LVLYVKNINDQYVREMKMEKIIWTGIKDKFFILPSSELNIAEHEFYMGFQRGDYKINNKYSNTEFLIMRNFNCMGKRQVELLHLWYSG
jgi:hypothetical protein